MTGPQVFTRKVMNKSGKVLLFPMVDNMSELYEASSIDIHGESITQEFPLGTKLIEGERVWRYTQNGGVALRAGDLLQAAAVAHAEQDDDIVCGEAAAAGAYTVEVTSTANLDTAPNNAADTFAEGYLYVNDEAGEGYAYKIKSNEALSGTDNATFTLYEPLKVALTVASQLGLIMSPYKKVIASVAVMTGIPVGVATLAVTADYFFWMQTGGPAAVQAHAAIARGCWCVGGTHAAAVDPNIDNTATLQHVGFALTPGVTDTETMLVFLTLDR